VEEATRPLLGWVAGIEEFTGLESYPTRVAEAAANLVEAGLPVRAVSRALADANDALTVRLLGLAEVRLGPPPCPYVWLILGSGGRREEALHSDQDNAVAYAEAGAGSYFAALADLTVAGLAEAGLPRCPGGYVATRWRYPLAEWERKFRGWVEVPEAQALVEAEVLLDFRPIHGELSAAPLDRILRSGGDRPRLEVQMARAAVTFDPPLGLFGRIRTRHSRLDLKRAGIAGIVLLARFYALAAGSTVRPTEERLAAAADSGTLSRHSAGRLVAAYRLLTELRLREQIRQVRIGGQPTNHIWLESLSVEQRRALTDALRVVRDLQQVTARNYHTDAVS